MFRLLNSIETNLVYEFKQILFNQKSFVLAGRKIHLILFTIFKHNLIFNIVVLNTALLIAIYYIFNDLLVIELV